MRPEEPLRPQFEYARRPAKRGPQVDPADMEHPKMIEADSVTDSIAASGGMGALVENYGFDKGVDFDEPDVALGSERHADSLVDTVPNVHPYFVEKVKKHPGLIEGSDGNYKNAELFKDPGEDYDVENTLYHGRSMEPPVGFLASDHPLIETDLSNIGPDSEPRESGVRTKALMHEPEKGIAINPEDVLGGARGYVKVKVEGDQSRAPFAASTLEKEDETMIQKLKKKIIGKTKSAKKGKAA